jgi:hypothetical protein
MVVLDAVMPWVVGLVIVALVTLLSIGIVQVRRERRPMSADWCRECMKDLRRGEVYELRLDHEADEQGGGTFLAATYCRRHAPKGALRA